MKIIVISDIHGDLGLLSMIEDDLRQADYILLSGDITHFGKTPQIKKIIDTIKMFNLRILAIPGNCDHAEVNQYLVDEGLSLDCRFKIENNLYLMGVGGSLPCPGKTPLEYSEEEFANMLEITISENKKNGFPVVLMTHQPPFNTAADRLNDNFHVGSHSIRFFIEKYQPVLCFCGHIHESTGTDRIGKTIVVNPGPFKQGKYTRATIINGEANAELVNVFEH